MIATSTSGILFKWLHKCLRFEREWGVEYKELLLSCQCGEVPKHISAVGLSANQHLVLQWRCPRCRREVCMVKPLEDCWRDCPSNEESKSSPATIMDNSADVKFLQSVGVKYPDE